MPGESLKAGKGPEVQKKELSFAERRDEVFDGIVEQEEQEGVRHDAVMRKLERVFEHSLEDGIRLADRLRLTPGDYQDVVLRISFGVKHPKVYSRLMFQHASMPPARTRLEHEFDAYMGVLEDSIRSVIGNEVTLSEQGQKRLNVEQSGRKPKQVKQTAEVDDLYVQALAQRRPIRPREDLQQEAPNLSKGERAAERYIEGLEEILERRFYTNPVKEMFPALAQDPALHGPNITEDTMLELAERYHLPKDDVLKRLAPARLVAYKELDAIKRGSVIHELSKEIKAELPPGKTLELDREKMKYQVVDEEKPEIAKNEQIWTPERLEAFENKAMDRIEEYVKKGLRPNAAVKGLTGFDSPRAWQMRKALFTEGAGKEAIIMSLAGLDSKDAWEARKKLGKGVPDHILLASLAGVDSPDAWKLRDNLSGIIGISAASLAGLDSKDAWDMRKEIDDHDAQMLSLTGVDSPEAWEWREDELKRLEEESKEAWGPMGRRLDPATVYQTIAESLVGIDSPQAWDIRWRLKEKGVNEISLAISLAGLDSKDANRMRDGFSSSNAIHSSVGLDSKGVWDTREYIERTGYMEMGDIVESTSGDQFTSLWRLKALGKKTEAPIAKQEQAWTPERLAKFDAETTMAIDDLVNAGSSWKVVIDGLYGVDTPKAWMLRADCLEFDPAFIDRVVASLGGIDSGPAWELRERLLGVFGVSPSVLKGLAGVDSKPAWALRERAWMRGEAFEDIIQSLVGMDSERAWTMRNEFMLQNYGYEALAKSLSGLDSKDAWKMRKELLALHEESVMEALIRSLAGLDSKDAWEMRNELLPWIADHEAALDALATSLAGVNSSDAWKMREKFFATHGDIQRYAKSLVGIDDPRATKLREGFAKSGAAHILIPSSMAGDAASFVWRLHNHETKAETPRGAWSSKLELLNLVADPSLEGIRAHQGVKVAEDATGLRGAKAAILRSGMLSDLFSDAAKDPELARALLERSPAVPDRNPERLAEQLLRRMLPSQEKAQQPSKPSVLDKLRNAFSSKERPSVAGSLGASESYQAMGGGAELLSDTRKVLESSEPMDDLLVNGSYGRYNADSNQWEKVHFPARKTSPEVGVKTTLTMVDVAGASRVALPLPLDARLVAKQVVGFTKSGKPLSLRPQMNAMGEANVEIPKGVVKLEYDIERALAPEPMADPSSKEHEAFMRKFLRDHGKDLVEPLMRLPQELTAMLRTAEFKDLSPKEQVIFIESLVRKVGWYDVTNEEVSQIKFGKDLDEQMAICEERAEGLRNRGVPGLKGKLFAGVCSDYAQITASLLREAGFPAGVMRGIHMKGEDAGMRDNHATAFVPWPDEKGGIRIIAVDGTPSSSAEIAANVARPPLGEIEAKAEKAIQEKVVESDAIIESLLAAAKTQDVETIKKMSGATLEKALNVILKYEVKRPQVQVLGRVLDAYWYGGLAKADKHQSDIGLRGLLEDEIGRAREAASTDEKEGPAGTALLEIVKGFARKFQKGGAAKSPDQAFDILDRVGELSKNELSDTERRALAAVTSYLRAQKAK